MATLICNMRYSLDTYLVMRIFKFCDPILYFVRGPQIPGDGLDGITLCQEAYAMEMLVNYGMNECNPSQTPMEARLKLSKMSKAPAVDSKITRVLWEAQGTW